MRAIGLGLYAAAVPRVNPGMTPAMAVPKFVMHEGT
jgi:hypothetical protein